uniref:Uncharacterized protein n=1 Tax=Panagrolaimus sp. JU765 TaxID=591449 RepID=A0AC34R5B6_9BILA
MRKDERIFLNSLSTEIRAELKLICGFCGSHTHGSGPGDKEAVSESTTTMTPEAEIKSETEKFFKFHDDSLDELFRQTEEELLNESECANYFY